MKPIFLKNPFLLIAMIILTNMSCRNASTGVHKKSTDSSGANSQISNAGNYNGSASGPMTMDSTHRDTVPMP